nr:putative Ig domain-containing protein [Pseudomonas sp. ALS1131]
MAVTFQQQIAALYSGIFNRAPDKQGLEFWVAHMEGGLSLSAVAEGFTNHPVFTETYSGMTNLEMVSALYMNMLGSAGDEAGIQFWVAKLDAGASFGQVVSEFIFGALTIDLDALLQAGELSQDDYIAAVARQDTITNKVDAGLYFVEKFGDASNLSAGTDAGTKAGLESDAVYLASQAAIANVTADASSVVAAKEAIDNSPAPRDLLVVVSGEAIQGGTLVASNSLGSQLTDISYQWLRDGVEIDGANSDSYVLTQDDVGAQISVVANYTDGQGEPQTVSSVATSAVQNVDDEATGELSVTGIAEQGATLTADLANLIDADGEASVAYQWQVQVDGEWVDIDGENAAELSIAADQSAVGQSVRVVATTTDALGGTTVFTGETLLVANVDDEATGELSVTGTAEQGATLTADLANLIDADGEASVAFQWQVQVDGEWVDIDGATEAEFAIANDQSLVGQSVRVVATTTDALGGTTVFTGESLLVANVDDEATGELNVTGTAEEGGTLTAELANLIDADGEASVAYQWQVQIDGEWVDIDGENAAELSIAADQSAVGQTVRVVATSTDSLGGTTVFTGQAQTIVNVDDEATGELSVTGTAEQGATLTADLANLVDADGEASVTYQWQVQVDGEWTAIDGATAATFTIADDQSLVGQNVRVVATSTDALGGTTVFTGEAQTIGNVDDEATGELSVTGTAEQGATLTAALANLVDADGEASVAYQWQVQVDGEWIAIDGATEAEFTIANDQSLVGQNVRVVATSTDSLGGTTVFTGEALLVDNVDDAATGELSVTGTAEEGGTLTANLTASDVDGGITTAYQWQVQVDGEWTDIVGATEAEFAIADDQSQVGQTVRVVATTTDALGGTTVFTGQAQTIANVDDEATGTLTVTGTAEEGGTLTANLAPFDEDGGVAGVSFQWQVQVDGEWTNIDGATSNIFAIADDQSLVGQSVRVVATSTDDLGGTTEFTGEAQTVTNVNDAPTLANAIADQSATQGQAFSFTVPANTFADVDGDTLSYSVELVDENGATVGDGSLPSWLSFDAATGTFSGTPADGDVGVVNVKVTATDGSNESVSDIFSLTQIDDTAPEVPGVTLLGTDDTGLTGDLVTNKTAVTLNVGGIEAGGRAWLDKDGNGTYDAGVDRLAVDGAISVNNLVIGGNTLKVISEDASGNTSSSTITVVRDTAAPNRDVETPVSVDSEADGTYSAGDTITLMFGEVVHVETLTSGSITVANGHLLGDGAQLVAVSPDANGYSNTFQIVLGTGTTLAAGDTISFASGDVVDIAGNMAIGSVAFTLPAIADEIDPVFTSEATAAADESQNVLYTAAATDATGVTYSLQSGNQDDASLLSIDPETGVVTLLAGTLDEETKDSYSFTVVATDGSSNQTTQAVTVSVNDLDEVAPTFTSATTADAIDENTAAAQVVYTATVTDDGDISGGVTFSLKADNNDDAGKFTIDEETGAVTLTDSPDYETQSSYSFTVVATDAANNWTEQTVTLAINDVDDTAPAAPTVALVNDTVHASDEVTSIADILATPAEGGGTLSYRVGVVTQDGTTFGEWSSTYTAPTEDGTYTVEVTQTDAAENTSEAGSLTFTLDTTAATSAAESPIVASGTTTAVGGVYQGGSQFTLTFSEAVYEVAIQDFIDGIFNAAEIFGSGYSIQGVAPVNGYASSFTLTLGTSPTLREGEVLSFASNVFDIAGNVATDSVSFEMPDVTPPTFSSSSVADGGSSTSLDGSIDLTFSEAISDEKSNFESVTLLDANSNPVEVTVTVDENDPTIVHITPVTPLDLAGEYTLSWSAGAFADAIGNAAAASAGDGIQFTASGAYTGSVAEIAALTPVQMDAATSLTVQDTAENLSSADFTAGNLAFAVPDAAERTITIDASDVAIAGTAGRYVTVTVGILAPVSVAIGQGSSADEVAQAIADALIAAGGFDNQDVTVSNGAVTLAASLDLGKAAISVEYAEVVSGGPIAGTTSGASAAAAPADSRTITIADADIVAGRTVTLDIQSTGPATVFIGTGMSGNDVASALVAAFNSVYIGMMSVTSQNQITVYGVYGTGGDDITVSFNGTTSGAAVGNTVSTANTVDPTSKIGTITLADGETANAYLQIDDLAGRTLALDNTGTDVTGLFVVKDSVTALKGHLTDLSGITGIDSYEVSDTPVAIFNGDVLSTDFSSVLAEYDIGSVTVTDPINLAQVQALSTATQNEANGGTPSTLTYDITDSAAQLLAADESGVTLINAAGDADVSDENVGALTYEQLTALYSLIDEDSQAHDQQLTYSLTASSAQVFAGDELATGDMLVDYLPNASSITVEGATVAATETTAGDGSTQEVQTIAVTPANGGEYRLTVGNTVLRTDVLDSDASLAELVAALQQSENYSGAGFTIAASGEDQLTLTWNATGDQAELAQLTTVNSLNLVQAEVLLAKVAEAGDDLTTAVYDLKLTAAELTAAYDGVTQRALLNGARDITIIDSMTVEQAGYFTNITNSGVATFDITDTAANLASGSGIIESARDLESTTIANASQAQAIYADRGDSGTLAYNVTDSIGNLVGANAGAMSAAGDIVSTGYWTSVSQAQTVLDFDNVGYVEFLGIIRDSVGSLNTFIDTNGAGEEDDTDGLRPYTYYVRDTAANISAAAADAIDPLNTAKDEASETTQHVLLDAELIEVTDTATYDQAALLVNNLHTAEPTLLTEDRVSYSITDTVANLGNERIWLEGDAAANDFNRATSYVDYLYVNDSAANIAAAQNANGVIDGGDREVFQRMEQVGYGGITATGSDGSQTIAGSKWTDYLNGGEGNDTLYGNAGNDTLYGGNGNDTLYGGDDRDTIYAGTGAGAGTGTNWNGISNWVYGGNGGDNLFGSGVTGTNDRDQFIYVGNTKAALVAESGTFTTTRDYINNMGYGDSIEFSSVDNSNIFFQGTSNNVANAVEAGTLALAISYDRNVQVANWSDSGLVTATKVNIDIANAAGQFDGVADMSIIIVGSNMDINWDGNSLVYGA